MILAKIQLEIKEEIYGKEISFNAEILDIRTKKERYRRIFSEYEPHSEYLYPYRFKTDKGLDKCIEIMKCLGYELKEVLI